jgi:transcriptional regulator with XRE-family HTH domain
LFKLFDAKGDIMELDYKAIGKRIKIARIKADLTQEKLAETIELSPTHLSNIETGTTRVSLTTIVSLANALSVSVDDLLCDSVIKSKPQFEKDIKSILEDCNDYEIRIIKDMMESMKTTLRRDANLRK